MRGSHITQGNGQCSQLSCCGSHTTLRNPDKSPSMFQDEMLIKKLKWRQNADEEWATLQQIHPATALPAAALAMTQQRPSSIAVPQLALLTILPVAWIRNKDRAHTQCQLDWLLHQLHLLPVLGQLLCRVTLASKEPNACRDRLVIECLPVGGASTCDDDGMLAQHCVVQLAPAGHQLHDIAHNCVQLKPICLQNANSWWLLHARAAPASTQRF